MDILVPCRRRRAPASTSTPRPSAGPARWRARAGRPVVELARSHTTVSVERATLRLAGLSGADHESVPWVNHLVDAVRGQVGLEHGVTTPVWDALRRGGGRRPADPGAEGGHGRGHVPPPGGHGLARARRGRAHVGRARHPDDRPAARRPRPARPPARRPEAEAVDLPHRRHRRHLRGHPAGPGGRARGRRRHRRHPLHRPVAARLRARGRDPRGVCRHLRHPGELPADAGGPRRVEQGGRPLRAADQLRQRACACPRSPRWPGSSGST